MQWFKSTRTDDAVRPLADRHYNRQTPGARGFAPPGRCLVLKTQACDAFWITSWPYAQYVKHAWPGAWICSAFRNEGPLLSSFLIHEALQATHAYYGAPPAIGIVTFVDPTKTKRKRDPGRCFRKAGFHPAGKTVGGLVALWMPPWEVPAATPAIGALPWKPAT